MLAAAPALILHLDCAHSNDVAEQCAWALGEDSASYTCSQPYQAAAYCSSPSTQPCFEGSCRPSSCASTHPTLTVTMAEQCACALGNYHYCRDP